MPSHRRSSGRSPCIEPRACCVGAATGLREVVFPGWNGAMCKLYSQTKSPDAMRRLFAVPMTGQATCRHFPPSSPTTSLR
jgi:hypothetical protein